MYVVLKPRFYGRCLFDQHVLEETTHFEHFQYTYTECFVRSMSVRILKGIYSCVVGNLRLYCFKKPTLRTFCLVALYILFTHAGNMAYVTSVVFLLQPFLNTDLFICLFFEHFWFFQRYVSCLASSSYVCCFKPSFYGRCRFNQHLLDETTLRTYLKALLFATYARKNVPGFFQRPYAVLFCRVPIYGVCFQMIVCEDSDRYLSPV